MPVSDHLEIVAFIIAIHLAIAGLTIYIMLPRSRKMSEECTYLVAALLFALGVGSFGLQHTLRLHAPNLYAASIDWLRFESWNGAGWAPDIAILILTVTAVVILSGRPRPVC